MQRRVCWWRRWWLRLNHAEKNKKKISCVFFIAKKQQQDRKRMEKVFPRKPTEDSEGQPPPPRQYVPAPITRARSPPVVDRREAPQYVPVPAPVPTTAPPNSRSMSPRAVSPALSSAMSPGRGPPQPRYNYVVAPSTQRDFYTPPGMAQRQARRRTYSPMQSTVPRFGPMIPHGDGMAAASLGTHYVTKS